jgi:hypothetical protein
MQKLVMVCGVERTVLRYGIVGREGGENKAAGANTSNPHAFNKIARILQARRNLIS